MRNDDTVKNVLLTDVRYYNGGPRSGKMSDCNAIEVASSNPGRGKLNK